jgi:short-subunit dehydrogenase
MDAANQRTLITPPERCAADILRGIQQGRRRVITGYRSSTIDWLARLLPESYPRLLARVL